jgi:hypothetical protein
MSFMVNNPIRDLVIINRVNKEIIALTQLHILIQRNCDKLWMKISINFAKGALLLINNIKLMLLMSYMSK